MKQVSSFSSGTEINHLNHFHKREREGEMRERSLPLLAIVDCYRNVRMFILTSPP